MMTPTASHTWKFFRAGGFDQVKLQSGSDLPHLDDFEQYLITAEAGVQSAITTLLNVRLVVKDSYDNAPAPGRKSNDVSIMGALAIRL